MFYVILLKFRMHLDVCNAFITDVSGDQWCNQNAKIDTHIPGTYINRRRLKLTVILVTYVLSKMGTFLKGKNFLPEQILSIKCSH